MWPQSQVQESSSCKTSTSRDCSARSGSEVTANFHRSVARLPNTVDYKVGAMIELPRAAVCAGQISKHVSFISFGTNDLTQMTYGFSRDDARSYLDSYLEQGILKLDPFITIDREGVGHLMEMAIKSVRLVNPAIKIGVCGEHGGDPESIHYFQALSLHKTVISLCETVLNQIRLSKYSRALGSIKRRNGPPEHA